MINRAKLIKDYAQRCADSMDVDALVEFVRVTISSNMAKMTDDQVTEEIRSSFPGMLRGEDGNRPHARMLLQPILWIPEVDSVGPYWGQPTQAEGPPRRIVWGSEVVTISHMGSVIGKESLEENQGFHDKSTGKIYVVHADGTLEHINMEDKTL